MVVLLLMTTGTLFARKKKLLPEIRQIIPLTELSSEMIEDLTHGRGIPDLAIECQPETELSPKLSWHYGVFSALLNPPALLKVNEPFYFRVNERKLYVSHDLIDWEKPDRWFNKKSITNVKFGENKSDVLIETDFVQKDGNPEEKW